MAIVIHHVDLRVKLLETRIPFRYGIATMTVVPHVIARIESEIDGEVVSGFSADHLPPKWFTKDPNTSFEKDVRALIDVIQAAASTAVDSGPNPTAFRAWEKIHEAQELWAEPLGYPPLLWTFGVTFIERALVDAFCRRHRTTFASAVRDGGLGIELDRIHPELQGRSPACFIPGQPQKRLILRHTVGLTDAITEDEAPAVEDGLPASLEASVKKYGLSYLKIKVSGDLDHDIARLTSIADLMDHNSVTQCSFTLDGNEQFNSVEAVRSFVTELGNAAGTTRFMNGLILIEQPLHRNASFGPSVAAELAAWTDRPPLVIDEADGYLQALPDALATGYDGTSVKSCKGIFKAIANACLLAARRSRGLTGILSAEDLATVGPVSLLQDLAVVASLGVPHVERNGHHYFRGLSQWDEPIQEDVLRTHGDLYVRHEDGYPTLAIDDGYLSVGSVVEAPFGLGFTPDIGDLCRLEDWDPGWLRHLE